MPAGEEEAANDAAAKAYPLKSLKAEDVDMLIRLPTLRVMSHRTDQGGGSVFAYIYAFDGASHGAEIPAVFSHDDGSGKDRVCQAWASFARSGVPIADGLPDWEPYTRAEGATMILDVDPTLAHHHDQDLTRILVPTYEY